MDNQSKRISQKEITITKTAEQWIGIQTEINYLTQKEECEVEKENVVIFSNEISNEINKLIIGD